MKRIAVVSLLLALAVSGGQYLAPQVQAADPVPAAAPADPDFGPNVVIFDEKSKDIQKKLDDVYGKQHTNQFGEDRNAFLFKPGKYYADIRIGFYTSILGLGQNPDDVALSGSIRVLADWMDAHNATCNFWRSMENLNAKGDVLFAVSQGTQLRRIHVGKNLTLAEDGWSSGGFFADCKIGGTVGSYSQQQWFSRNSEFAKWSNGVWNQVFVGDKGAPAGKFPNPPYTVIEKTPVMAEKPYLMVDKDGKFCVLVPDLQKDTVGTSWAKAPTPGKSLPIDDFYIAKSDKDTADSMNAALKAGKNLIITPGIYNLKSALTVTRANTVVLGLGYATLRPEGGTPAIEVADVDGVKIGGLLLEATDKGSKTLLQVGKAGSTTSHAENPICIYDIVGRVGGSIAGKCDSIVTIDAANTLAENFWLWRADHGNGAAWKENTCANGLIVNGKDVTIYGLFVEHTQEYQTVWNGENGHLFFYQSEMPYDPPSQDAWKHGKTNGYASYKVGDNVKNHEAWGLGVYCYFSQGVDIWSDSAIEAPVGEGIKMHHLTSIFLNGDGGIHHILNDKGGEVKKGTMRETLE